MSRTVYLHIGAPKTGTTYIQDRLALNASTLSKAGIHLPRRSPLESASLFHFRAALDLLGRDWGGKPGHAEGAWDAMVKKVKRLDGTVIISHEILAPAPPERIAKAVADLGDCELHVIYTVRDLGRQLPAAWQESIKQGRRLSFRRFMNKVENGDMWFSRAFDLPTVLNNWSDSLPPERVHVVTVPSAAAQKADRDLLWKRFCEVLSIQPAWVPAESVQVNRSMGIAETQLVRALNKRVGLQALGAVDYARLVRQALAQDELANRKSAPVTLDPERFDWAEEQARLWIDWVEGSGVDLVGSTDDLLPVRPGPNAKWRDPDMVKPKAMLKVSLEALAVMTREAAARNDPDATLRARARRKVGQWRDH